jgi:flagellar basal body rod protein FlgC
MMMAKRAFEANIAVVKATRKMAIKALEIGR